MSDELETLTEGTEWRSLLNIAEQRAVESAIRGEALDFAGDSHSDIRRARDPLPVIRARVIEVLALRLRRLAGAPSRHTHRWRTCRGAA
jgi:hypothetical protein